MSKSSHCHECDCGFNTDDYDHHTCGGKKCFSCHRRNCPGNRRSDTSLQMCCVCLRSFYGEAYYRCHWSRPNPCVNLFAKRTKHFPEFLKEVENNHKKESNRGDRRSIVAKYR